MVEETWKVMKGRIRKGLERIEITWKTTLLTGQKGVRYHGSDRRDIS